MRLISFQHRDILNELNKSGIYECRILSKFHASTPEAYDILAQRLKLNKCISPIFAWYNVKGLPLEVSDDTIERALSMTGFNMNEFYLFELEVPEEFVDLQYFYNFVDMRCVEEFDDTVLTRWKDVFNVDKNNDKEEIQATLPCIKNEWIKNIYEITYEKVKEEFDSSMFDMNYLKEHNLSIPKYTHTWRVTNINKLNLKESRMELF